MYWRHKNNQCLSYTTWQKKWNPFEQEMHKKNHHTLTFWAFNRALHDHVFTRPEVKILCKAKIQGQNSLWKCGIKTVNIYSAHMETFNQVNINLIFTVSWREKGFLSLCPFNKKHIGEASKAHPLLGCNRVKYLHFTDTCLNFLGSRKKINKFLYILLYLKVNHAVYKDSVFFLWGGLWDYTAK